MTGFLLCCLWSFFQFGICWWQPRAWTLWFSHNLPRDLVFCVTNWSIREESFSMTETWTQNQMEAGLLFRQFFCFRVASWVVRCLIQSILLVRSDPWLLGWSDAWYSQSFLSGVTHNMHSPMKVRKSFFCLRGTLEHGAWMIARWQVSNQSPLICHLAHILTWLFQFGRLLGHLALKSSHFSPTANLNSLHCWSFFTLEPPDQWPSSSHVYLVQVHLCLQDLFVTTDAGGVFIINITWLHWMILKVVGNVMMNWPLMRSSIRLQNWSTLLLTWDLETVACSHIPT